MLAIMTTGLQKVVALDRAARRPRLAPRAGWLRGLLHGFHGRVHRFARRTPTARTPTARDLHDAAVLRGVFPPRV